MTKMTYVSAINAVLTAVRDEDITKITPEVADKLLALGESLEKRNSAKSGKPTKKQTENAEVKNQILDALSADTGRTCGEIANEIGITGQKCSALLKQMCDDGMVAKYALKRVTYFVPNDGVFTPPEGAEWVCHLPRKKTSALIND